MIVQVAIAVDARRRRRRPRTPRARQSRCCAGSRSRSCSAASPSSTTRSSRRSARQTSTSATCCASPRWVVAAGRRRRTRCAPACRLRAEAAIAGERRRLARELHDGVAQELAFIRRRAGRLRRAAGRRSRSSPPPTARWRTRGARSRRSSRPPTSRCDVALERLGARLATECGLEVQVNVRVADRGRATRSAPSSSGSSAEAVRNAANHGGARHVRVDLAGTPLARARSSTTATASATASTAVSASPGYGLIAMRERAEQVGGQFSLESVRGAGTLVQVVLP